VLTVAISHLITLYAKWATGDEPSAALQPLKVHQREHIALGTRHDRAGGGFLVVFKAIRSKYEDENQVGLLTPDTTKHIFSVMFSPTIMLLIGGWTISAPLVRSRSFVFHVRVMFSQHVD